MWGPHAVIIAVSQGHDIVAVTSNYDEYIYFFFCSSNRVVTYLTKTSQMEKKIECCFTARKHWLGLLVTLNVNGSQYVK